MQKTRPSLSVRRSLLKLGDDIKTARLRRRIPMALLAERALIGLSTLDKIQKGDPGVSIGNYAAVIFSLGMGTPLNTLLDPRDDATGLALEKERLPQRIHGIHTKKKRED